MFFQVVSYHPAEDGGVVPRIPTFVEAHTWFSAVHIAATELRVVDKERVILKLIDQPELLPRLPRITLTEVNGGHTTAYAGCHPAASVAEALAEYEVADKPKGSKARVENDSVVIDKPGRYEIRRKKKA